MEKEGGKKTPHRMKLHHIEPASQEKHLKTHESLHGPFNFRVTMSLEEISH